MNYLKETDNKITLNVMEMQTQQRKIWTKYEDQENVLLYKIGEREFIHLFDRYLMQTLEEVVEVEEEFGNKKSRCDEEYLLEIVDVLMYSVTLLDIIEQNIISYELFMGVEERYKFKNEIPLNKINPFYDVEKELFNVFKTITSARRLYSARKWHKPHLNLTNEENLKNLIDTYELVLLSINMTASLLTVADLDYINNLISEKQKFIISL